MSEQRRDGLCSFNLDSNVWAIQMLVDLVNCRMKMLLLLEFKCTKSFIYPTSTSLDDWSLRVKLWENVILQNLVDQLSHLWLSIPSTFLMHVAECIHQGLCCHFLPLL